MKKYIFIIIASLVLCSAFSSAIATDIEVCQDPENLDCYRTINAALDAAEDGDTIIVLWEIGKPYYDEYLVIDKRITLTSDGSGEQRPRILLDMETTGDGEIIKVNITSEPSDNENVEISKLIIENSGSRGDDNPLIMTTLAGIRVDKLESPTTNTADCVIRDCKIIHCRTGIVIDNTQGNPNCRTWVDNCTIGKKGKFGVRPPYVGNYFGIVQVEPSRNALATDIGDYSGDLITNCLIGANKYYGVTLRGGSLATVENNLIVWNGTETPVPEDDDGVHYGDGGLLCLFTAAEISATDVKVQSPMIMSNNLYGNLGFQVCAVTEKETPTGWEIVNMPILMSNIIGPDPFTDATPAAKDRPFLISCTSESPDSATNPQYGSGMVMAYNNVYREVGDKEPKKYYAHPLDPTFIPPATPYTFTPTPAMTPTAPTPTPSWTPSPDATWSGTYTPEPVPQHPGPPTIAPTSTPGGLRPTPRYLFGHSSWNTLNIEGDPRFVGVVDDTPIPANFDFHLQDPIFTTATPVGTPEISVCFNHSRLKLEPGYTQASGQADIDWSDVGRHFPPQIMPAEDLTCVLEGSDYTATWTNPDRYKDNSLFNDLTGNIFYFMNASQMPPQILDFKYLEPTEEYHFVKPPKGCNYVGVSVYNSMGIRSDIALTQLPQ